MGCGSSKAAAAEPAVFSTTVEPFEAASSSGESFTHISEKKESRVKESSAAPAPAPAASYYAERYGVNANGRSSGGHPPAPAASAAGGDEVGRGSDGAGNTLYGSPGSQNNSGEEVIDVVYSTEEEVLSTSAAQYQGAHRAEGGSFSSLGSLKGIAGTNKGSNRNGKSNIVFSSATTAATSTNGAVGSAVFLT
mmetsp:Transcript_1911/g.4396  ORF Transcript_1911/g.4396 Transcript_1911/m.4396 type:complete len:193 (+) Transcript_1911:155-733(+)|eukprot:CAMPEP_0178994510 /NCGR_PEP_ID=MMETSP0795-20121207/7312_1 /TAXON_ID=88552 /ORGANISM="Amoebophrya sp., Strain Ameob2" /LENGTH=192 /DNA_ID=CAMNT_0020686715 /DNA_START=86 /DNA_END=664 /DNA_ORIENTATION=+